MFQSLVDTFFGCAHSRTTFPMTRGRRNATAAAQDAADLRLLVGAGHHLRADPRAVALLLGWLERQA